MQFDFQGVQYNYTTALTFWPVIYQARNNIFLFGKMFLIAIAPLNQKQLKSRFRGNPDEDPGPLPLKATEGSEGHVGLF